MEHAAAIDVPGMEAAGISLEDYVYYHCRVHLPATTAAPCVYLKGYRKGCCFTLVVRLQ